MRKGITAPVLDDLASLERKLQMVRDRVTGVAKGYETGLYLFGEGGIGKSFTVLTQLEKLDISHRLFNSRMTAKGLFRAREKSPDSVHVLEDMDRFTQDRDAQGVLRSALWSQPGQDRRVTWTTDRDGEKWFVFRGGIILLANRPLSNLPELRALASRIAVLRLDVSDSEITAIMRKLAAEGYAMNGKKVLAPEQCLEVTEFLLKECRATGCPLDLRLLRRSYSDYLLWESRLSQCHWQDLVGASIREVAHNFKHDVSTLSPEELVMIVVGGANHRNTLLPRRL